MRAIVTADLHLTDNPKHEYRWDLFPWLRKELKTHRVDSVFLLGDITDAKDRHSSRLVNKLVSEIRSLGSLCSVFILRGNHDYLEESEPFFKFLNMLPGVYFITEPFFALTTDSVLLLPNTRNYKKEWEPLNFKHYKYIFTHQSYDGCISENGTKLGGIPPSVFKGIEGHVISGDIHVPQKVGKNITYVGAPYRIRFGDAYNPRVLLLGEGKQIDLHLETTSLELLDVTGVDDFAKRMERLPDKAKLKIRVHLNRENFPDWPSIRKEIEEIVHSVAGWELTSLSLVTAKQKAKTLKIESTESPEEVVKAFSKKRNLDKHLAKLGVALLKETV